MKLPLLWLGTFLDYHRGMDCQAKNLESGELCVLPSSLEHVNHLSDSGQTWANEQYVPAKVLRTMSVREFRQATRSAIDLANRDSVAVAASAQETSRVAAERFLPMSGTVKRQCYELILFAGERGMTDDELELATELSHQTISACRRSLVLHELVRDSGERRKNRRNLDVIVWKCLNNP